MPNSIKLSSLAQRDLMESTKWYNEQKIDLGEEFAELIHKHIRTIAKDPLIYKKVKKDIREFVVEQFPFTIIYKYNNDRVNIMRIFHTSRNPKLKYRLK